MADVNKSIEIQYKADLGQLLAQLKKLPNMTEKEAKKMVGELNKQLRRAEKEAKKASKSMAASMKQSASSMGDLGQTSANVREEMGSVAESAGDVDRGFASIGLALSSVNPQLAETAMMGADVAAVSEGLLMTFKNLHPALLASAAAVAALTLGYAAYADGVRKAGEQTIALREAEKSLKETQDGIRENLQGALDDLNKLRDEQAVYTGELTKEELERKKASESTRSSFEARIDLQKEVIKGLEEDLRIVDLIRDGNKFLSDSEKDRLITLHNQIVGSKKSLDLEQGKGALIVKMRPLYTAITEEIKRQEEATQLLLDFQAEAVEISETIHEIKKDESIIQEDLAAKEIKKAIAAQEIADAQQIITSALQSQMSAVELVNHKFDAQKTALENIRAKYGHIKDLNKALEAIEAQRAEELVTARQEDMAEEIALAELKEQIAKDLAEVRKKYRLTELRDQIADNNLMAMSEEELHQLRIQLMKEEGKEFEALSRMIDAELQRRVTATQTAIDTAIKSSMTMLSAISQLAGQEAAKAEAAMDRQLTNLEELEESRIRHVENAVEAGVMSEQQGAKAKAKIEQELAAERLKIEREMGQEAYKARLAEFRLNQATASSNVVMSTAVAIAKALELGPVAGPVAAGFISAAGLAQLAVVANQQPPVPTFDVGGMIGSRDPMRPDDAMIRARQGEAILDRATVQRIGGERGVKDLQQGGSASSNVVVISPWKHFDRFNRARQRAGLNQSASGQRGY